MQHYLGLAKWDFSFLFFLSAGAVLASPCLCSLEEKCFSSGEGGCFGVGLWRVVGEGIVLGST